MDLGIKSGLEPADKGSVDNERGVRPRHEIRAAVAYWGTDLEGGGSIANISTSGTLIEPASSSVAPGTRLGLLVAYWPDGVELCSVELSVEVVRTTDSGFAVRFKELGPEAMLLLDELL